MQRGLIRAGDVTHALDGDQEAFSRLVVGCQGTLYAAAMAILRHEQDALDAVQDAILIGWRKLNTLRERRYFDTWMTRIVIRAAIDMRKKRRPAAALSEVAAPDSPREEILDIRRAMEALDERTRLCAALYYYEGMSTDGVARATGLRPGTVKSTLFRARNKLRTALEVWDDE